MNLEFAPFVGFGALRLGSPANDLAVLLPESPRRAGTRWIFGTSGVILHVKGDVVVEVEPCARSATPTLDGHSLWSRDAIEYACETYGPLACYEKATELVLFDRIGLSFSIARDPQRFSIATVCAYQRGAFATILPNLISVGSWGSAPTWLHQIER